MKTQGNFEAVVLCQAAIKLAIRYLVKSDIFRKAVRKLLPKCGHRRKMPVPGIPLLWLFLFSVLHVCFDVPLLRLKFELVRLLAQLLSALMPCYKTS